MVDLSMSCTRRDRMRMRVGGKEEEGVWSLPDSVKPCREGMGVYLEQCL